MTDRELMQQALEALEEIGDEWGFTSQRTLPKRMKAIEALRERLAQPEMNQWHGLTDEEINSVRHKRDMSMSLDEIELRSRDMFFKPIRMRMRNHEVIIALPNQDWN